MRVGAPAPHRHLWTTISIPGKLMVKEWKFVVLSNIHSGCRHLRGTARSGWRRFTIREETYTMDLTISEGQTKELIKEALTELLEERSDLFFQVILEAIEEAGLSNAIREGRQNDLADEEQVLAVLRGNA